MYTPNIKFDSGQLDYISRNNKNDKFESPHSRSLNHFITNKILLLRYEKSQVTFVSRKVSLLNNASV